jgi:creatinine amidohydrolase
MLPAGAAGQHGPHLPSAVGSIISAKISAKKYLSNEKKLAMHTGHSESALVLALAPDSVRMDRSVANFLPESLFKLLPPDSRLAFARSAR